MFLLKSTPNRGIANTYKALLNAIALRVRIWNIMLASIGFLEKRNSFILRKSRYYIGGIGVYEGGRKYGGLSLRITLTKIIRY